jgi:C1A family cysteine protease
MHPFVKQQMSCTDYNPNYIPLTLDWRRHGVVNPIRAQGKCGSCWAFSAIGVIESMYARKTGKLL